MPWTHIAGTRGIGHCLYWNPRTGELAITDDSLRFIADPSSTDEGLLLVARDIPIEITPNGVVIPVRVENESARRAVVVGSLFADLPLALRCRERGCRLVVSSAVEHLAGQLAEVTGGTPNPAFWVTDRVERLRSSPAALTGRSRH